MSGRTAEQGGQQRREPRPREPRPRPTPLPSQQDAEWEPSVNLAVRSAGVLHRVARHRTWQMRGVVRTSWAAPCAVTGTADGVAEPSRDSAFGYPAVLPYGVARCRFGCWSDAGEQVVR